jgi:glyoxylase-like metal-dependent hydrolase (beta-lactamase superfamily II)
VFERFERDRALVRQLGLALRYSLETHVHADHVTAAWRLREALGSRIALSKRSAAEGADLYVGL